MWRVLRHKAPAVALAAVGATLAAGACADTSDSGVVEGASESEVAATLPEDELPESTLPAPTLPPPVAGSVTEAADSAGVTPDVIASPPRLVSIPSIDVEAEIIDLGLNDDGSLQTPTDFAEAGWWAGGATAAEPGPTVIVGHVDSYIGPAVFFELATLKPGDHIVVTDAHGTEQRFRVTEVDIYDKDNFPTDRVYGPSDEPTLRLVTCGGDFDENARSYEANWVVFADPV